MQTGLNPVKILVEDETCPCCKGGTGFTKCGGNYAGSILGTGEGRKTWLCTGSLVRRWASQICRGSRNDEYYVQDRRRIYTAPIEGTVLPGVTRDSMIHLLRDWGYKVNETRLSVDDLMKAGHDGTLEEEVFGTGTATLSHRSENSVTKMMLWQSTTLRSVNWHRNYMIL